MKLAALIGLLLAASTPAIAGAQDASPGVKSCRGNQLVGYGLVAGLANTGDSFQKAPFTLATVKSALKRAGSEGFDPSAYDGKVAAVMVTAQIKSCAYSDGSYSLKVDKTVDLRVSRIGDATSLSGGVLLMTPLIGADGRTYAIGQGALTDCDRHAACVAGGGVVAR